MGSEPHWLLPKSCESVQHELPGTVPAEHPAKGPTTPAIPEVVGTSICYLHFYLSQPSEAAQPVLNKVGYGRTSGQRSENNQEGAR